MRRDRKLLLLEIGFAITLVVFGFALGLLYRTYIYVA